MTVLGTIEVPECPRNGPPPRARRILPLSLSAEAAYNFAEDRLHSILRPANGVYADLAEQDLLWIREPFRLPRRFDHLSPTAAERMGAVPAFVADLDPRGQYSATLGRKWPARNLLRCWHRQHAIVMGVKRVRLQDLTEEEARGEGFVTRGAWAATWDKQRKSFGYRDLWKSNPVVLRIWLLPQWSPIGKES
ncbi:hypothetical protein [Alteraurantiacibacter palmitatis]|uniref:Uncharacterized protein n=1 Tax=Alteraurantiacibacter palmitatis TaxID=2054628 RepID=A0ABV7E3N2_9SPHN